MALPTGTFTATDLDVMIPEIWGERINEFYASDLMLADHFVNRSDELADGGDILHTPNTTELTASAKSNATAVTLVSPTETKVDLTVDQWYEASFVIEDKEAAQVKRSYAIQEMYARNAGYAVAKKLEVALATLFSGFSQVVGTSTTSLVDSDIRKAIGLLEAANVRLEDCKFYFDSKVFWNQVMGLDRFVLNANTPAGDPVNKGKMGMLYGIPVATSNNIQFVSSTTGRNNAIASKDAIHWATSPLGASSKGGKVGSKGVRVQSNYIPEYLGTLTTADILYGVIENRDAAGVLIRSAE